MPWRRWPPNATTTKCWASSAPPRTRQIADAYRKLAHQVPPRHATRATRRPSSSSRRRPRPSRCSAIREKRARYDRYGHAGLRRRRRAALPRRQRHLRRLRRHLRRRRCSATCSAAAARRRRAARAPTSAATSTLDLHRGRPRRRRRPSSSSGTRRARPAAASGAKPGTQPRDVPLLRRPRPGRAVDRHLLACRRPAPPATAPGRSIKRSLPALPRQRATCCKQVTREVQIPAGVDDETRRAAAGRRRAEPQRRPAAAIATASSRVTRASAVPARRAAPDLPGADHLLAGGAGRDARSADARRPRGADDSRRHADRARCSRCAAAACPTRAAAARGDLLVQVHFEVPKKLTPRQEELLRELAEEEQANVSPHRKRFFEKLRKYFVPEETTPQHDTPSQPRPDTT